MGPIPKPQHHSVDEWLAQPESARLELVDGEFVEKAGSTFDHGHLQARMAGTLDGAFNSKPGGWWIGTEIDILLDGRGFRPDISGWRRERMPVVSRLTGRDDDGPTT